MVKKSRTATIKDVRYALEYGGERLLRTYTHDERHKGGAAFSLSKSGTPVDARIAESLLGDPHIIAVEDGLFPGHSQQYEWQADAA